MSSQENISKNNNKIPVLSYQIDQKIKSLIISSVDKYADKEIWKKQTSLQLALQRAIISIYETKIYILYGSAIPLLSISPRETPTYTRMFNAALLVLLQTSLKRRQAQYYEILCHC